MTFRWIAVILISCHMLEAGWLDKRAEGWAWYEEEKKGKIQEDKPQESPPSSPICKRKTR